MFSFLWSSPFAVVRRLVFSNSLNISFCPSRQNHATQRNALSGTNLASCFPAMKRDPMDTDQSGHLFRRICRHYAKHISIYMLPTYKRKELIVQNHETFFRHRLPCGINLQALVLLKKHGCTIPHISCSIVPCEMSAKKPPIGSTR
jgi:hypothetical protein